MTPEFDRQPRSVEFQFSTGLVFVRTADGDEHQVNPREFLDRYSLLRIREDINRLLRQTRPKQ